jgi:hypothetical protein
MKNIERASYNGSIEASQASDVGSIPIARSRNSGWHSAAMNHFQALSIPVNADDGMIRSSAQSAGLRDGYGFCDRSPITAEEAKQVGLGPSS